MEQALKPPVHVHEPEPGAVQPPVNHGLTTPYSGVSMATSPSLPGLALRLDLVRLYFDYIHDQFHSLFHRPSFVEDVLRDRVPPAIICGMIALSARYAPFPRGQALVQVVACLGNQWHHASGRHLDRVWADQGMLPGSRRTRTSPMWTPASAA